MIIVSLNESLGFRVGFPFSVLFRKKELYFIIRYGWNQFARGVTYKYLHFFWSHSWYFLLKTRPPSMLNFRGIISTKQCKHSIYIFSSDWCWSIVSHFNFLKCNIYLFHYASLECYTHSLLSKLAIRFQF